MILPWSLLPFLDSLQNWSTDTNFSLQSQMFQYSDLWIEKSWISKVSNSWTRDHWADELLGWSWTSHRSHLGFSNLIDWNQKITINWNLGNVVYRIHIWCLSITDTNHSMTSYKWSQFYQSKMVADSSHISHPEHLFLALLSVMKGIILSKGEADTHCVSPRSCLTRCVSPAFLSTCDFSSICSFFLNIPSKGMSFGCDVKRRHSQMFKFYGIIWRIRVPSRVFWTPFISQPI